MLVHAVRSVNHEFHLCDYCVFYRFNMFIYNQDRYDVRECLSVKSILKVVIVISLLSSC